MLTQDLFPPADHTMFGIKGNTESAFMPCCMPGPTKQFLAFQESVVRGFCRADSFARVPVSIL